MKKSIYNSVKSDDEKRSELIKSYRKLINLRKTVKSRYVKDDTDDNDKQNNHHKYVNLSSTINDFFFQKIPKRLLRRLGDDNSMII